MAKSKTPSGAAVPKGKGAIGSNPSTVPVLPDGAHTLATLEAALGKPDEGVRRLLLRNSTEQDFYEWGVSAETGNILADIPRFVSSAVRILGALDAKRRELVLVPATIFAVLVAEARVLEGMSLDHQAVTSSEVGGKSDRELTLKRLSSEGVALRNRVLTGLRNAVGDTRLEQVRKAGSDASTSDALATGLHAVAAFITQLASQGTDDDRAALDLFQVDPARAEELKKKAAEIVEAAQVTASTSKRVSKRALDIQDGRVLVLVDMVYRAFRVARRTDKSLLLPELNRLSFLFDSGGPATATKDDASKGGKGGKGGGEEVTPS